MAKTGEVRYDEEGNDKTYEDDDVSDYWMKHYVTAQAMCSLCDCSGVIDVTVHRHPGRYFCICPNGQAMRWHLKGKVPERK